MCTVCVYLRVCARTVCVCVCVIAEAASPFFRLRGETRDDSFSFPGVGRRGAAGEGDVRAAAAGGNETPFRVQTLPARKDGSPSATATEGRTRSIWAPSTPSVPDVRLC